MQPFSQFRMPVGTSEPTVLFSFRPRDISSLLVKTEGSIYLGVGGVSTTNGLPLHNGDGLTINQSDFSKKVLTDNPYIQIYAIADVATECAIMVIRS